MSNTKRVLDDAAWKEWNRISISKRDLAVEYVQASQRKSACCMPYDCMCHEMCGEPGVGYCGTCKHLQDLDRAIGGVSWVIWECARYLVDQGERQVISERLDHARDLEAVGDYAGAARLLGEEEWA